MQIEVACAVEGDYVPHSAAMLASVLANSGASRVRVHYLHGPDFAVEDSAAIAQMVVEMGGEAAFLKVDDERCSGLPIEGFTGKATWYRTMLPDLLPDIARVLCLDADLLVMDSLEPLWTLDLEGSLLAAVTNVLAPQYMDRPAELGISPHAYFNAGVMLLDLDSMRANGSARKVNRYGVDHAAELALRDQDAMNFVLAGRRKALSPRWNTMNAIRVYPWSAYVFTASEIADAIARPAIRHFEGPGSNKPWHTDCEPRWQAAYLQHRRRTPWPDFTPERGAESRLRRWLGR